MKIIYFIILFIFNGSMLWAQSPVRALGNDDFNWPSEGLTGYNSIAIDKADNIYVAFQDSSHENKITVRKYDGVSWKILGEEGFSAGEAQYTSIAINSVGVPYVTYKDALFSNKIVVKNSMAVLGYWLAMRVFRLVMFLLLLSPLMKQTEYM